MGSRTALVTGGTDGIGRAVAIALAGGGDRVLVVGRSAARGAKVLAALEEIAPGLGHRFFRADLSLLGETSRLADEVEQCTPRLDAAVFCAGILSTVPEWTEEELERSFVLNYLSRYLLARRLLPALRWEESGRLVLVSNAGMYADTLDFDDLQYRRGRPGLKVAGRTQFANDLFCTALAARLRNSRVEVTCVFPGVVRTDVFRNARGLPWFMKLLAPIAMRLLGRPAHVAAATPVWLAQDPGARGTGGRFFGPNRRAKKVPPRALRPDRQSGLWQASEALVREYLREE